MSLFTTADLAEISHSIENYREVPLKFAYLGKGGKLWGQVDHQGSSEQTLLVRNASHIIDRLPKENLAILDVGSGDSEAVWPLASCLASSGFSFRYLPLDFSTSLLGLAFERFSNQYPHISVEPYQINFDSPDWVSKMRHVYFSDQKSLITLLGSTLCNQREPVQLLSRLQELMKSDDFLLIGTEIMTEQQKQEISASWIAESLYDIQFSTLEALGLSRDLGTLIARFNQERNQTEVIFQLEKDILFPIGETELTLKKGEELLLMRIMDFSGEKLKKTLQKAGLGLVRSFTSPDYALSLVQKI